MKGVFTVSLDFELHWGGFEKWPLERYRQYFTNTRSVIPDMLRLFEENNVHVTWATVGLLFHQDRQELDANKPRLQPGYANRTLSAYEYITSQGIGENEKEDPFHFASSLVKRIIETPNQELGTHTYAHFYCNEPGQTVEEFRADLRAAQSAASVYGRRLSSLVFPRNQFNDQYLKVCYEEGIRAVRSNPVDWFWRIGSTEVESFWKRLNRGADAYINIGSKTTYKLNTVPVKGGYPVALPASRLLRPYRPNELFLNSMKLKRIKDEMEQAARDGEVYHLWWHPHNFGWYPRQSLEGLRDILQHFRKCADHFGMTSLHMGETASLLTNGES